MGLRTWLLPPLARLRWRHARSRSLARRQLHCGSRPYLCPPLHGIDGITRPLTIDDIEERQQQQEEEQEAAALQPGQPVKRVSSLLTAPPLPLHLPQLYPPPSPSPLPATIYQLSSGFQSPSGHSSVGVAIIRLSGPLSLPAALLLSRLSALPAPRRATRCSLWDVSSGRLLDSPCLMLSFPAPHSFTGEDVVELHVHGNPLVVRQIMTALHGIVFPPSPFSSLAPSPSSLSLSLREASAGEFTRRAFLNSKLDLLQVEALSDLLTAATPSQQSQALSQLSGSLSSLYESWCVELIGLLAHVEAVLDFSADEPDVSEQAVTADILPRLKRLTAEMRRHAADEGRGESIREGVEVCLLGCVNVGKSSIMNALAGRAVSIVSAQPGTTRDVMEARLDVAGYAVRVLDTAGLRDSRDGVEAEGVRRARSRAEEAAVKVLVFDGSAPEVTDDMRDIARLVDAQSIVVFNKIDLLPPAVTAAAPLSSSQAAHRALHHRSRQQLNGDTTVDTEAVRSHLLSRFSALIETFPAAPLAIVPLSTLSVHHDSLHLLTSALSSALKQRLALPELSSSSAPPLPLITRERHRLHVEECIGLLDRCLRLVEGEGDLVLGAEQLRFSVRCLGRVVGRVDVEEILDVIFADFCIGK